MTHIANKPSKSVAVYARVSTARQEEEKTVETQLAAIREFAKDRGFNIVHEYIDDGWSGDTLARPQLDKLRQHVSKKAWQGVLFYDPDRLARRYSYQELVMDELREKGVEILFVTTPSPQTGEEKILHGVKGLFAEYERIKITERFRLGKMRKAKEGHVLASEAPYGYVFKPKSETDGRHGHYEINEKEARIVSMIYSWIADEQLTIRRAIKRLQQLKIPPRWSDRGVWSTSTLGHLLRNRTYIGEAHYASSYSIVPKNPLNKAKYRKIRKTSRKMKPEDEWIKIPVPAILEPRLFERAQTQLRRNFERSRRNRKNEYLLSRLIRHACGATMAGEGPHGGRNLYYRCTDRIRSFPLAPKCNEGGLNARIADRLVWIKISELMSSPELLRVQIKRWIEKQHNPSQDGIIAAQLEPIKAQLARLKKEEDRYAQAYGAGIISLEQLSQYTSGIRRDISSLEQELITTEEKTQRSEDRQYRLPETEAELETFAREATKNLADLNFQTKRAIVMNVIDSVVASKKELRISGFIPVHAINNVKVRPIDRHQADTNQPAEAPFDLERNQLFIGSKSDFAIPFDLTIPLPEPQYKRLIIERDKQGRITHSAVPPPEFKAA